MTSNGRGCNTNGHCMCNKGTCPSPLFPGSSGDALQVEIPKKSFGHSEYCSCNLCTITSRNPASVITILTSVMIKTTETSIHSHSQFFLKHQGEKTGPLLSTFGDIYGKRRLLCEQSAVFYGASRLRGPLSRGGSNMHSPSLDAPTARVLLLAGIVATRESCPLQPATFFTQVRHYLLSCYFPKYYYLCCTGSIFFLI